MVEKSIWNPSDVVLGPKLPTLDIWLIFFYFSTFLPGGKMELEVSRCDLKPQNGQFRHLDQFFFLILYFANFLS